MIKEAIAKVVDGEDLTRGEMRSAMEEIMGGEASEAQIGSFLTALRMKGEKVEEITAGAEVMREKATAIKSNFPMLVDTCGTGGDGAHTFNISTAAAFVVAGCGLPVAKHGNRSVSSRCGSADVLVALGVNIEIGPEVVEKALNTVGIGFLFAPLFHPAMKYAIGPRRAIGVRTIFNVLGPLTNPARARAQLVGVYDGGLTESLAQVLGNLGAERSFVVHGEDGLDEVTLTGATRVSEFHQGQVKTYSVRPEDFGLSSCTRKDLAGGTAEENASIVREILQGGTGPRRDVVMLNAAFALVAGGSAKDVQGGIEKACQAVDSGEALKKLQELQKATGGST